MNNLNANDFNRAMVDVRKAYRLIYSYQRRLLDTVQRISQIIGRNVISGYSLFSDYSPRDGARIDLNRSAWDWLNMYAYEFYFESITWPRYIKFAIAFQADTGSYDVNVLENEVEQFSSADLSESYVYFFAGGYAWNPKSFQSVWEKGDEPKEREGILELDKEKLYYKRFPLSSMLNEESIIETLEEANRFFENNGIEGVCSVKVN